jgi:ABC-type branched-subunit amino acid transport system substrate-binding protein
MMQLTRKLLSTAIAGLVLAGTQDVLHAEPGVSSDQITFGQAAAFEGPAAALGRDMRVGIKAAFEEANRGGGIKGRKLSLVSLDDGYEPNKSIEATRKLIEEENVFALVGSVGTPTSEATQPIAAERGIPFIGPFTGAEFLRHPFLPNVVNVRGSYFQETEEMIERLTKDRGFTRISILYQDDAFGRAGLAGVQKALHQRGLILASEGTFERNTVAIKAALLSIRKGDPEAVILIGPYKPCAEFIKLARQMKMQSVFVNISFVGSNSLANELGPAGTGVVVTQVVPFPTDASIPVVARYQAAISALGEGIQPGFVSLEGYLVGRLIATALERLPDEPTRQDLLNCIFSNEFDLGGVVLSYGQANNQGSNAVYLTVIQPDGSFRSVTSLKPAAG